MGEHGSRMVHMGVVEMRDERQDLTSESELDRGPFWAYISVTSHQVNLAEITRSLGIEADESHDIGSSNPYRDGGVYKWSNWELHLDLDDEISMGTEGLSQAVEALGDDLADRLADLATRACEVSVMVVQELDDQGDTGIHLTAGAIRWIARAGAFLDVDQYVRPPRQ